MSKNRRGFTLVELMVVVAICVIALGVIIVGVKALLSGDRQESTAKQEAEKYAKDLNIAVDGITCANYDSDNDGYVSCTLKLKSGQLLPIECRGAYSFGHGCRTPKLQVGRSVDAEVGVEQ